jgi:hypothetical protein
MPTRKNVALALSILENNELRKTATQVEAGWLLLTEFAV